MARLSDDDTDKALWLTLAQSWVLLAEHAERGPSPGAIDDEGVCEAASAEHE